MDPCEEAYKLYQKGTLYFNEGDFNQALEFFLKSNEIDKHFKTYARIYECLLKLGKHSEAKPFIKEAYLSNPNQDKVALQYSEELVKEGDYIKAKDVLEHLLTRNKTYNPARKLLEKINRIEK